MRRYKRGLELGMTLLILVGAFYIGRLGARVVETAAAGSAESGPESTVTEWTENPGWSGPESAADQAENADGSGAERTTDRAEAKAIPEKSRVVIDPGHGGSDGGKVGVDQLVEKELNLAISLKLKELLEQEGVEVVMTRDSDAGLYDEGESNKKQQDMKRRAALINESGGILAVSIHQNSYPEEYVKGPQVFYYATSGEGQKLAQLLQQSLNERLEVERPREVKGNDTYYLLRKTSVPTVIVECGFLSNVAEARRLATEEYQQQTAQALCAGILEYLMEECG